MNEHAQKATLADDTYVPPQSSPLGILGVWAAAAVPMGLLGWVVAPRIADGLSGPEPLARALIACLTIGLIWQFVLVAILVRREQGSLAWPKLRDALWLRAPRSPKTGQRGGRVWWWIVPFALIFVAEQMLPSPPMVATHDLGSVLDSQTGKDFFAGNWEWFSIALVMFVFNTVLGEELLFRGWLLPRMNAVCGRWDWLANGVLFGLYHLHMPWAIPGAMIDAFALALPSKWLRSAWMGIVVHSLQSLVLVALLLALVLK
ncbi:MAG: CPBP family intramembrane metalloprotease [Solirubrobacterales bacterium]